MADQGNKWQLGDRTEQFLWELADVIRFSGRTVREIFRRPFEWEEFKTPAGAPVLFCRFEITWIDRDHCIYYGTGTHHADPAGFG